MGTVESLLNERQDDYGDCVETHTRMAGHISLVLGVPVTARQAALCMVAVKLARESHQHKDDNCDDGGSYFEIAKQCAHAEDKPEPLATGGIADARVLRWLTAASKSRGL